MYCPSCGGSNPPGASYCNKCGKQLPSLTTSVTCPFCGADGQEFQFNCTKCGKELPREQKISPYAASTAGAFRPSEVNACPSCGRPKSVYAAECPECSAAGGGYDDVGEVAYTHESELPVIGGVLIIIAGVLGIVNGLLFFSADTGYGLPGPLTCCLGLMILFGLAAIAGGFSAIGRGSAAFAIIGGVLGILAIGFFLGALLSLIGLILVAVSYHEFEE